MAGSSSKSRSQVVDRTPREFKALREPFADFLLRTLPLGESFLSGEGFDGGSIDLNRYRSPITAGELSALAGLEDLAEPSTTELLSTDLLNRRLRGDFLDVTKNAPLMALVQFGIDAINEEADREGQAQRSLFASAGQRLPASSPFAEVSRQLESDRLGAIGQTVASLLFPAQEAERQRQTMAIEQARANAGFEFERQLEFFQANALPRLIDEIGFDRAFAEFEARLAGLSQALGLLGEATAPALGVESSSRSASGGIYSSGS